jgi:hypothetical protein
MKIALLFFIFQLLEGKSIEKLPELPPPGPTDWVVKLVDQVSVGENQYNYLFRGNLPLLSNTEYNYKVLISSMNSIVSLPNDIFVVDIALQWNFWPDNSEWINTETSFFSNNSKLGMFLHWPLYGNFEDPNDDGVNLEQNAKTLPLWQIDQLPQKMKNISDMLHTKYDRPRAFYFHCHTGSDRTGEFAISYSLMYKNISYQDAVKFSNNLCQHVNGRNMTPFMAFAAEWYCYYLYYALGRTDLSCHLVNH